MSDKRYGVKLKRAGKPIGLEFKSGQKYTTSYKLKQNLPAFIKIYCLQLNETIESSKCSKLLAICPGIDKNDSGIYHYQPLTEHFRSLAGEINQMNFELRDERGELLEMDVGTATYIRLKIIHNKEHQLNMTTVNINSHDETSKLYYPSNSNSQFTNHLPVRLLQGLSKWWTIKLISLCMPHLDFNVYPDFGYIKVKILDKIKGLLEEFVINIPPKNYKSLALFKKAVNFEILAATKNQQANVLETKFGINIQESDKSRLTLFNKFPNKEVSLGLNNTLAYMLGIRNNVHIVEGITNEINEANLTPA